jgi:predicted ATPase
MSNHYLQNIKVKGYKSIKDLNLAIEKLNVLIGQNGAGKSNFISLFKFLRNIIEERLQNNVLKAGGAEAFLFYGAKQTKYIEISLDFSPNIYEVTLQPTDNDSLFITNEYCGYWNKAYPQPYLDIIGDSTLESSLKKVKRSFKIAEYVYDVLKEWRVYHFHDTGETAGIKKYNPVSYNRYLFEDASNLAAFLYLMKTTDEVHYGRIVKTIQLVIPFFNDFELRPNPSNPEIIRLEWSDKNSDRIFDASAFSDGSLRFICLATLLLQPKMPKMVLLDEPELGLHPSAISVLAGLLRKASVRSQVIVSTQSVNLVNEFEPEDIIVVDREHNASVFHRLDNHKFEKWLEEYSMGDLWEKNVIGGRP